MQKLNLSTRPERQRRVLAVHDISCVGRCSLTVALPVLSAMGFETSILPFEDCCTVFTPKHPKTRPVPARVEEQEAKLPFAELCDAAMETLQTFYIKAKF